jgi:hypothetical protein
VEDQHCLPDEGHGLSILCKVWKSESNPRWLTLEGANREVYLLLKVSVPDRERFDKWDANRDGFLTRQEFVTQRGMHPKAK